MNRPGRIALGAAVLSVGLVAAWAVGRATAPAAPARPSPVRVPRAAVAPPPRPSSAEQIALRIAAEGPGLASASDSTVRSAVATWAEAGVVSALAGQIERAGARLRADGGESFWAAPLAWFSTAAGPGRERVDVLSAEVINLGGAPTYLSLAIEEMDFDARGARWGLAATRDLPAPVLGALPGAVPTPAPEAAAELAGYVPTGSAP